MKTSDFEVALDLENHLSVGSTFDSTLQVNETASSKSWKLLDLTISRLLFEQHYLATGFLNADPIFGVRIENDTVKSFRRKLRGRKK